MDGLARTFLNQPVVFLQYQTNSGHAWNRLDRFMAAWQLDKSPRETTPGTPYTMVDSGQAVSYGERDYQREYRQMIDGEIPRPPTALLHAHREMPSPTILNVAVQVTNISTETLRSASNAAMLHLMLYTGNKALGAGTDIHDSRYATFDEPLAPGETRQFEFSFTGRRGVVLSRADVVAMVDYQPSGAGGRWDMMQAIVATSADLPPIPTPYPPPSATPTRTPVPSATPTDPPTAPPTAVPTWTPVPTTPPDRHDIYLPCLVDRARVED